jgi:hypothetical protein
MGVGDDRLRAVRSGAAALALGALTAAYCWPIVGPGAARSLGGDFAAQSYPGRRYATALLSAGRLPHWAPQVGFGFPLLADIETSVFYPPSLIVSALAGPDVSYRAIEIQAVLHHVIAGLGMFLLLTRLGAAALAAFCGGVMFAFSGFFWAHGAHLSMIQSGSWGPWVLLGGVALVERPGARAVVGMGTALALAILGGHPQIAFLLGLALLIVLAVGWWRRPSRPEARVTPVAGSAALAVLLAAGLTAIQLLPTAVLTRESIRWRPSAAFLQEGVLPVGHLVTFLVPLTFHETARWVSADEYHGYVGILTLVMAVWALIRPWTRWAAALATLGALGGLIALGVPPFPWLGGAALFRIPARAVYLVDLGLSALAGLGVDAFLRASPPWPRAERWARGALWMTAGLAVALAAWLAWTGGPGGLRAALSPQFVAHYRLFVALLAGAALAVEVAHRLPRRPWLVRGVLLVVLVHEVLAFPRAVAWSSIPAAGQWPPRPDLVALGRSAGPHRVYTDGVFGRSETMQANIGLLYGLPLTSLYSSLALSRYAAFEAALLRELPRRASVYDLMGVGWVWSRRDLPRWTEGADGLRPAGRSLWQRPDGLPRAYLPVESRVVRDRRALLAALAVTDPRQTVLVERGRAACPGRTGADPGEVRLVADEPDRVRLAVSAREAGHLVLSDTYYPGWHATVDGAPTRIHAANLLFRTVCIPAGAHIVEFTFHQPGFVAGAILTGFSGLAAVGLLIPAGDWRRRWWPEAGVPVRRRHRLAARS